MITLAFETLQDTQRITAMHTVGDVMTALKKKGSERYRQTMLRHGAPTSLLGVSIADLKVIARQIKGNQGLACELYDTGNPDAQYLAGLVADGAQMTKKQLDAWAKAASWKMIAEFTVPWVASESPLARELALKWIAARQEAMAAGGWCTYSGLVAVRPDAELDLAEIEGLLNRVVKVIHTAPNLVRSAMNGFVIAVGTYVKPLLKQAKAAAKAIGAVSVDMGDTACQVPLATERIAKVESAGKVGKKRKTNKC